MRHLLLAFTACAASAPAAQAQSAVPQAPQSPSPKARLAEVLRSSKRNDAQAASDVTQRLTTDPDTTIRRVAALALTKMADAATSNAVRSVAISALQNAATHDPNPKLQAEAAKALARLQAPKHPTPAIPWAPSTPTPSKPTLLPSPPATGIVCTSIPVIARVLNLTGKRIDVCAAFQRASSQVTWPTALPTATAMRVELTQLDRVRSGPLICRVTITTSSQNGPQSQASGGASVSWDPSGGNRFAERDCVDAVVESLLVTKVVPGLQAAGSPSGTAAPAPAASGSTTSLPR